jgi:hypothetical protein
MLTLYTSTAVFSQQLPSQIQAKRGVFTERFFLNDRWIDRISTSVPSIYDSSNNVLPTTKAMADLFRQHSIQTASVTADSNYIHNWNHKQLRIDSINHLQFDAFETDSTSSDEPAKVHNSIRMGTGLWSDNAINLTSVARNPDDNRDSITSGMTVWSNGARLDVKNDFGTYMAGVNNSAVYLSAFYFNGDWETSPSSMVQVDPYRLTLSNSSGEFYLNELRPADPVHLNKPIVYDYYTKRIAYLDKPTPVSFSQTSAVTVSGTTNETSLTGSGVGSLTIPASTWKAGKTYRVTVHGAFSAPSSSLQNFTLRLHIGNATVATTASSAFSGTSGQFSATIDFTCLTSGTFGTVYAFGTLFRNNNIYTWNALSTLGTPSMSLINITTDVPVDVTAQLIDASASVSAYIVTLEEIN